MAFRPARTLIPLALVGYLAMLGGLGLFLSQEMFLRVFVEGGVFERASLILWLVAGAAAVGLLRRRVSRWLVSSLCIVLLACAAREADLHNALTGYSVLKIGYYVDGERPLIHRIAFGLIMLLLAGSLVRLVIGAVNRARMRSGPLQTWELSILLGIATMALTKLADRAPDVAEKVFGLSVSDGVRHYLLAFEEGAEALVPLFAIAATALFISDARGSRDRQVAMAAATADEEPSPSAATPSADLPRPTASRSPSSSPAPPPPAPASASPSAGRRSPRAKA